MLAHKCINVGVVITCVGLLVCCYVGYNVSLRLYVSLNIQVHFACSLSHMFISCHICFVHDHQPTSYMRTRVTRRKHWPVNIRALARSRLSAYLGHIITISYHYNYHSLFSFSPHISAPFQSTLASYP